MSSVIEPLLSLNKFYTSAVLSNILQEIVCYEASQKHKKCNSCTVGSTRSLNSVKRRLFALKLTFLAT